MTTRYLESNTPTRTIYTVLEINRGQISLADRILDTKDTSCPLPILQAKQALDDLAGGETLESLRAIRVG